MEIFNNIGQEGCGCGDYLSENLIAKTSCRKSSRSPECSEGIAHLLTYNPLNEDGLKEVGGLIDKLFDYAGDCVVVVKDEELEVDICNPTINK